MYFLSLVQRLGVILSLVQRLGVFLSLVQRPQHRCALVPGKLLLSVTRYRILRREPSPAVHSIC